MPPVGMFARRRSGIGKRQFLLAFITQSSIIDLYHLQAESSPLLPGVPSAAVELSPGEVGMIIASVRGWIAAIENAYHQALVKRTGDQTYHSLGTSPCPAHPG